MRRHKPSERMPESRCRVLVGFADNDEVPVSPYNATWYLGCYYEHLDTWKVYQIYGAGNEPTYFGTSKIAWWCDPMENDF